GHRQRLALAFVDLVTAPHVLQYRPYHHGRKRDLGINVIRGVVNDHQDMVVGLIPTQVGETSTEGSALIWLHCLELPGCAAPPWRRATLPRWSGRRSLPLPAGPCGSRCRGYRAAR